MNRVFVIRRAVMLAGLAGIFAVVWACGQALLTSSAVARTPHKASGKPVVVYTSTLINSPLGNIPQLTSAINAGLRAINNSGGLDGHKVILKVCSDSSPNAEVLCARNAAAAKAIAFVSPVFLYDAAGVDAELNKYHIPNIAGITTQQSEYVSPMSFPVDAPELSRMACPALMPKLTGLKKIGQITFDAPTQIASINRVTRAEKNLHEDNVGQVVVPANTADFSSAVQQLSSDGAQIVIADLTPSMVPAFLSAAASLGEHFDVCTTASQAVVEILSQLGPAANGVYLSSGLPAPTAQSQYPLLRKYAAQMAAEKKSGDATAVPNSGIPEITLRAWLGTQVLARVAKSVPGKLTNQTLVAALDKATVNLGGVVPTLDYAKPDPYKGYSRVFNPYSTLLKWDVATKSEVSTGAKRVNSVSVLVGH